MKDKLLQLMKSEGLTSSRLAEMLEVQPSGISHILSGRNKPGFDFLQKILRRFPQINPDWLLLDSGAMYRAMQDEMSANQAAEVAGAAGSPAAVGHDTGLPEGYVLPGFDVDAGVGRVSGGSGISPASGAADVSAASGFSGAARSADSAAFSGPLGASGAVDDSFPGADSRAVNSSGKRGFSGRLRGAGFAAVPGAAVADRAASGVSNAASRAVAGASSPSGAASSGARPVDSPAVPCGESGGVTVDCATDGVVCNGFAIPRIERIVVFYSDGTFCDYSPKK
ncbi:helix-turn-helix transcriptional regulator [uncultured Alistipes sp.]|uniref:helix-turn-helix domain-containing protein n=1 Tax=uncultured Alistipes sp. TaxID=538949 RepID=UPI0026239F1B|nr:helix-turn-helix transcriptional regulator [uncultured Alistipes sp.]